MFWVVVFFNPVQQASLAMLEHDSSLTSCLASSTLSAAETTGGLLISSGHSFLDAHLSTVRRDF